MGKSFKAPKVVAVQLYVKNLQRDAEFYRDALGLDLHCIEDDVAVIEAGELMLLLFKRETAKERNTKPVIVFETSNLKRTMAALKTRGVRWLQKEPQEFERGFSAVFQDLSGNRHEYVQYTE